MEILTLSAYQEKSYIEKPSSNGYIDYGDDNLYPQYLVDLYKSSATHNALCTSIAYMIFGKGVVTDDLDARLKIQEWGLDDEIRKACLDLKIQGGFALEIIYSLDRTNIAKVRHLPFENIRSGEVNDDEVCDYYYYSKDWSDRREEPQVFHAFDPEESLEHPCQIMYIKPFSPGSFYYPKPDYIGSVNYIELDKEISIFHINNIKNGLAPSFMIHFKNGTPSMEERNRVRNDIETQLAGTSNTGKFFLTFNDQPDRAPDFEPFPLNDADKQYQFLSTEVTDKIMVGHRVVSPAMFGVKTAGQLGSTQELDIASKLFNLQVVHPYQAIVDKALKSLFNACGITAMVSIGKTEGVSVEPSEVEMEHLSDACNHDHIELEADWLISQGEVISDEYELVDERTVDYDSEDAHDSAWLFAKPVPKANSDTSEMDNDIVKVRYFYDGGVSSNTREFCRKMVSANKVYRKEDIIAAGNKTVNKGFGEGGSAQYSIWLYKGGAQCHHRWVRRTYLQKNNERVSVAEAKRIIDKLPYEERKKNLIPPNDNPKVSQMPYTMPNNGYVNPR